MDLVYGAVGVSAAALGAVIATLLRNVPTIAVIARRGSDDPQQPVKLTASP